MTAKKTTPKPKPKGQAYLTKAVLLGTNGDNIPVESVVAADELAGNVDYLLRAGVIVETQEG